jgi:hypothetical protein
VKTDPLLVMTRRWWPRGRAKVAVLEPVAVAFEADDLGVVDQAVDHGGGDHVVVEHLAPAAEWLVAGDDQAGALVAARHELEEQVGGLRLEGDVADLVDDQQRGAAQPDQLGLQPVGGVGVGQAGDPLRGGGKATRRPAWQVPIALRPATRSVPGGTVAGMQQTRAVPSATREAVLERITYANQETGYTVARVATGRSSDLLTVVGPLLAMYRTVRRAPTSA